MAYLIIDGKEYQARTDFKFLRVADEKYAQRNKEGNEVQGGFHVILNNLLEENPLGLSQFWDCALAHLKEKPSADEIEKAIFEQEDELDKMYKSVYTKVDSAGFLKSLVKKFWKQVDMMKDFAEDEKQEKAFAKMVKEMKDNHKRLTSSK